MDRCPESKKGHQLNPKSCYYYTCQYGHKEYIAGDTTALRISLADCATGSGYLSTIGGTVTYELCSIPEGAVVVSKTETYTTNVDDIIFVLDPPDTDQTPGLYQEKVKLTDIDGNVYTLHCCTVWIRSC